MKTILAWHFTDGMKLRDGDDLVVGKTYRHTGQVEMCKSGYHASERLVDALKYAPGSYVSRVKLWGDVHRGKDKLAARNRKVLWTIDATKVLHLFACAVAEDALKKIENPDPRSFAAIETKRRWLEGKATDEELEAAESAAWSATWSATRSATRSAAWSATWSAAWSATRSATRSATWSAAESATWSAAESALNDLLTDMVHAAHDAEILAGMEATDDRD